MFCPDDIEIIKGSPSKRRTFLNVEISQMDNKYLKLLNEYNKILKNRNEYIKNYNFDKVYFDIITDQLVEKNIEIYNYRNEFITNINKYINKIFKSISKDDSIYVKYETFINELNIKNLKKK